MDTLIAYITNEEMDDSQTPQISSCELLATAGLSSFEFNKK